MSAKHAVKAGLGACAAIAGAFVATAVVTYQYAANNADRPRWVHSLNFVQAHGKTYLKTPTGGFPDHPGELSLRTTHGGLIRLSPPVTSPGGEFTFREVTPTVQQPSMIPTTGAFTGHLGETPGDFGLTWEDCVVGGSPAWRVQPNTPPADVSVWAIHLHGHGSRRSQTLRSVTTLSNQGATSLVPTGRTSHDHAHPSRRSTLGREEWKDLRAAHDYALRNGATHILYVGWSLGAIHALRIITHHSRENVAGAIFVSPAVDIAEAITASLHRLRIPKLLALAIALLGGLLHGAHPGWTIKDELHSLARDPIPMLILQGEADRTVPFEITSRVLSAAGLRPQIQRFAKANHTLEYNADPELWEATIARWYSRHIQAQRQFEENSQQEELNS